MGTLNFTVTGYAKTKGSGAASISSTDVVTSGAYGTSGSASNVEDASGDIDLSVGQVFECYAPAAMRLSFGGVAATTTTGFYLPAGVQRQYEVSSAGTVSAIDV